MALGPEQQSEEQVQAQGSHSPIVGDRLTPTRLLSMTNQGTYTPIQKRAGGPTVGGTYDQKVTPRLALVHFLIIRGFEQSFKTYIQTYCKI